MHSHYEPPAAPVEKPAHDVARKTWKWLLVPVGHALLLFSWEFGISWWNAPASAGALDLSIDGPVAIWAGKEALYEGAVLLVTTGLFFALLPRINLRQTAVISFGSFVSAFVVAMAASYVGRPIETNGELLIALVLTYIVVLLVSRWIVHLGDRAVTGK